MELLNLKIKYECSHEHNTYSTYEQELAAVKEPIVAVTDPRLKGTVLDPTFRSWDENINYVSKQLTSMLARFKGVFIKETNETGYCYFDKYSRKIMFDSYAIQNEKGEVLGYQEIFNPDVLDATRNVICVIYKRHGDKVYITDHRHEEDDTFGYPQMFHSVPGGRRDSDNPLATFFAEAYEELLLGDRGQDFFHNAVLKGYSLNDRGGLYIFCEVQHDAPLANATDITGHAGFKPFTVTVYKNPVEAQEKALKLDKDEFKKYKQENAYKVLFPREQGLFDSTGAWFREISFDKDTLFGIKGRFDCYKKGSPVYNGLELILKS